MNGLPNLRMYFLKASTNKFFQSSSVHNTKLLQTRIKKLRNRLKYQILLAVFTIGKRSNRQVPDKKSLPALNIYH